MSEFGRRQSGSVASCLISGLLLGIASANDGDLRRPATLAPTIALEDIRVGMKGYGLSVFHGARIEPFEVVVVSVMRDYFFDIGTGGAQRGLIWIECTDSRMQHLGPVYGMSGSPIYLWDLGAAATAGTGGRLAGAFAMGFAFSETCYAGVQPIEQMRRVADRVAPTPDDAVAKRPAEHDIVRLLQTLAAQGRAEGMRPSEMWPLETLTAALQIGCAACDAAVAAEPTAVRPPRPTASGSAQPLLLPLPVREPALQRVMAPIMRRAGLIPVDAGGRAGRPPHGVDASSIRFAPGAVLAIPMVWGDIDYSASGTCTEVWPDGRVLAFGHAMYGEGNTALPIATGFVHMVMPLSTFSFKVGGSAVLQAGALVRDETSAVVTAPSGRYGTAAMTCTVKINDVPQRRFNFTIAHHRLMTPLLAAIAAFESAVVDRNFPVENTLHMRADMRFAEGRQLTFQTHVADTDPMAIAFAVISPLSLMANNPFEAVMVEEISLDIDVEPVSRAAVLLHVRVDRAEYAPGETVEMTATYQALHQAPVARRLTFTLPDRLPNGSYGIAISSADAYARHMLRHRPHLAHVESADDIMEMLQAVYAVDARMLYLTMALPEPGLAIRRTELPDLPLSRQTILTQGATTSTASFANWVERHVPLDVLLQGEAVIRIKVQKDLAKTP